MQLSYISENSEKFELENKIGKELTYNSNNNKSHPQAMHKIMHHKR